MKIPFDIKFRSQIESGEYKVVTRDSTPVRIVCWDANNPQPIVGLVYDNDTMCDIVELFCGNGKYWSEDKDKDSDFDLFIITPEPELTEFEKSLADVIGFAISQGVVEPNYETYKFVKDWSERLLELAKKELCNGCSKCLDEYWRGRKEAMEEESKGFHYESPAIPTFWPPCHYGGECTNPFHDCINCHRQSTVGINTTTGTSTAKVEGKE